MASTTSRIRHVGELLSHAESVQERLGGHLPSYLVVRVVAWKTEVDKFNAAHAESCLVKGNDHIDRCPKPCSECDADEEGR